MHEFSSTEKINLKWMQYLIYWIGAIWMLVIFANDDWVFAATVLFILFVGFFGIRQVGIFNTLEIPSSTKSEPVVQRSEDMEDDVDQALHIHDQSEQGKRKYEKSGLTPELSESIHRELTLAMRSEKFFRESEISLTGLANRLNTPPNYLSQVINEREGKNFYDYINTLRIEEFKHLAANPESRRYTLLALAQECGFNSKSSFNRYFKKVTGQSPSEFIETSQP